MPAHDLNILIITRHGQTLGPVASALFRETTTLSSQAKVTSAATIPSHTLAPSIPMARTLSKVGIKLENYSSIPLTRELVDASSHMLAQDDLLARELIKSFPEARSRIYLLNEWSLRDIVEPDLSDPQQIVETITVLSEAIGGWCSAFNREDRQPEPLLNEPNRQKEPGLMTRSNDHNLRQNNPGSH